MDTNNRIVAQEHVSPTARAIYESETIGEPLHFAFASNGLRPIPVNAKTKVPILKEWQLKASSNPKAVGGYWMDGAGVGLATGLNLATGQRLVVVDLDTKGANGFATLRAAGIDPDAIETMQVRTPSGGRHLYFTSDEPVRTLVAVAPGVDTRGEGGQVVAPGTVTDRGKYEVLKDLGFAPLPAALRQLLAPAIAPNHVTMDARKRTEFVASEQAEDLDGAEARCRRYLEALPDVPEGEGNATLYKRTAQIRDFGVTRDTALALMSEHVAEKFASDLDEKEIRKTVRSAYDNAQSMWGRDALRPVDLSTGNGGEGLARGSRLVALGATQPEEIVQRQNAALVKGAIPRGTVGVIYGAPGAGKTFLALQLAWCIAQGRFWMGRRTRKAPVLYVALEGVDGLDLRAKLAEQQYGQHGGFLQRTARGADVILTQGAAGDRGLAEVVAAAKELAELCGEPVGLIVIDTLSRALAGQSENDADIVSAFVRDRAGKLAELTGAAVALIHHENKGGDMRGSTALNGAADFIFRVSRAGDDDTPGARKAPKSADVRTVHAVKVKDGEEGHICDFRLKKLPVLADDGSPIADADGERITSCVVDPVEDVGSKLVAKVRAALIANWQCGERWAAGSFPCRPRSTPSAAGVVATALGISKDDAQRALEDLERTGELAVEVRGHGSKQSKHWAPSTKLLMPAAPAMSEIGAEIDAGAVPGARGADRSDETTAHSKKEQQKQHLKRGARFHPPRGRSANRATSKNNSKNKRLPR